MKSVTKSTPKVASERLSIFAIAKTLGVINSIFRGIFESAVKEPILVPVSLSK